MSNAPAIGITDDFGQHHAPRSLVMDRPAASLPARIEDEHDLARWKAERAEAQQQVSSLEQGRRSMLTRATVGEIQKHDTALATARVRLERAGFVIEDAEQRFSEQARRVKAAQPERRAKHKAAVEARDEAERVIREVYGPAAEMIVQALQKVVELQAVISAAGEPPEGEGRVPDAEAFRHPTDRGLTMFERLADTVRLPPIVRGDRDIWPARR